VLYNGAAPFPDEETFKLSDSFEKAGLIGLPEKGSVALELVVKVININEGRNGVLLKKCKTLAGYSAFVARMREFEKECVDRMEAMTRAVRYCRDHDILKEFLEQNATEVMNMLITEWKLEDALAVRFEEGIEKGIERGIEKGMESVARNALAKGLTPELICSITGLDMETIKSLQ